MLCKRCLSVMRTGTEYHSGENGGEKRYRRFYECKKCRDKIYTKEPNFQEYMGMAFGKYSKR